MIFGKRSKLVLEELEPELQLILLASIKHSDVDFGLTEGYRPEQRQNQLFDEGKSKVKFPYGKHNTLPSKAVDVVAYVNGKATYDMKYYLYLYGLFSGIGKSLGYEIRSGLNWDGDGEIMSDQNFNDGCHFELK